MSEKKLSSKNKIIVKHYGTKQVAQCLAQIVRLLLEDDNKIRM